MALELFFNKSCNVIEKVQNILKNRQEIKLKKWEIEKLKAEQEMRQRSHHILLPSDFQSISYLTKAMNDLPIELRNYK